MCHWSGFGFHTNYCSSCFRLGCLTSFSYFKCYLFFLRVQETEALSVSAFKILHSTFKIIQNPNFVTKVQHATLSSSNRTVTIKANQQLENKRIWERKKKETISQTDGIWGRKAEFQLLAHTSAGWNRFRWQLPKDKRHRTADSPMPFGGMLE